MLIFLVEISKKSTKKKVRISKKKVSVRNPEKTVCTAQINVAASECEEISRIME